MRTCCTIKLPFEGVKDGVVKDGVTVGLVRILRSPREKGNLCKNLVVIIRAGSARVGVAGVADKGVYDRAFILDVAFVDKLSKEGV